MSRPADGRKLSGARAAAVTGFAGRFPGIFAFALGAIAALAYPPLHLWPLGLGALAIIVWHIHSAPTWRSVLWRAYLFG
jgi:apolipoprotein N-acyltransferase